MAEVNPAGWFQALATHTAEQMRSYLGMSFAIPQAAQGLKTAGAVHPALGTAMAVTQNGTPNMTVNVGAGSCWIPGTETTKQGTYFCQNDASKSLTIGASDPTLNRIDLVVAKVQDAGYSGTINAWSLVVVPGTAAGSPVAPAAPANSITLAQVTVGANVTTITSGAISDQRPWNAALGGIVPATSAVRPANPYNGLYAHELDTFRTIRYNGTNWHQLGTHICTSTTRPVGPFTGMQIYETDTALNYQWNGTAWFMWPLVILFAFKPADDGSIVSTTLKDDAHLFFNNLPANTKWLLTSNVIYYADTTADFKMGWSGPAGATLTWNFGGPDSNITSATGTAYYALNNIGGVDTAGGAGAPAPPLITRPSGLLTIGGTSGKLQYRWAQNTSTVNGVNTLKDSWMQLVRVA